MKIGNDWDIVLKDVFESEDFRNLILRVNEEYRKSIIEIVNSIDNEKFLSLIHSLIISAIKKWL